MSHPEFSAPAGVPTLPNRPRPALGLSGLVSGEYLPAQKEHLPGRKQTAKPYASASGSGLPAGHRRNFLVLG